jgi:hypothetical protein
VFSQRSIASTGMWSPVRHRPGSDRQINLMTGEGSVNRITTDQTPLELPLVSIPRISSLACPGYEMVGEMRWLSASLLASREDGYTFSRGSGRITNCS